MSVGQKKGGGGGGAAAGSGEATEGAESSGAPSITVTPANPDATDAAAVTGGSAKSAGPTAQQTMLAQ